MVEATPEQDRPTREGNEHSTGSVRWTYLRGRCSTLQPGDKNRQLIQVQWVGETAISSWVETAASWPEVCLPPQTTEAHQSSSESEIWQLVAVLECTDLSLGTLFRTREGVQPLLMHPSHPYGTRPFTVKETLTTSIGAKWRNYLCGAV